MARLTARLDLSVTPEQRQALENLAAAADVKLSWLVRRIISDAVLAASTDSGELDPDAVAQLKADHELWVDEEAALAIAEGRTFRR